MSLPEFNTYKVANASDRSKNFKVVTTNHPATNFPIGINMLDIKQKCNPRIRAYADNVSPADSNYDQFVGRINLETWADTHVYGARCTWLDISKHSLDFQFGKFSSGKMGGGSTTTKSIDIQFTRPYHVPPKVVVWLTSFDSSCAYYIRMNSYAENITTSGFKLWVLTWGDSIIYNTMVTWIAVPSDNPNMTAGLLVTPGPGTPSSGSQQSIIFDKPFKRVPRVMVALNKLDIQNSANLRITAHPKDITAQGYIAIDDDTPASRN